MLPHSLCHVSACTLTTGCPLADAVVGISIGILIALFIFQRVGTSKIGFAFSPIVIYWFVLNGGCGIFNIARYYPGIFKVPRCSEHFT